MRAKDNPFRVDLIEALDYRPQGMTWGALLRRLADLGHRAAIVGNCGTGKTTLIDRIAGRLADARFRVRRFFLNGDARPPSRARLREFLSGADHGDMILFDGADHLPRLRWMWFRRASRSAGGLIVTSHRSGLLPTLVRTSTSPQLMGDIVGELAPGRPDLLEQAGRLYARHRGNIRDALRDLYDLCAGWDPECKEGDREMGEIPRQIPSGV